MSCVEKGHKRLYHTFGTAKKEKLKTLSYILNFSNFMNNIFVKLKS